MPNNKIKIVLIFSAIAAINFVVFYPSFFHIARGDQILLLIDTARFDRFPDLLNFLYSFNRNNVHVSGDYLFFRPLFFFLIALQKSFFGLHFSYWQITGWLLHLCVLIQLTRVLVLIRPRLIAFGFVLWFSVLYISQEMVIWHHVSGYLLFLVFLLEAFYHFIRYIKSHKKSPGRLAWMAAVLTLACFTCEFGVVCSLMFWASIVILQKKGKISKEKSGIMPSIYCLLPIGIFLSANFYDFFSATQFFPFPLRHLGVGEFTQYLLSILTIAVFYGFLPYFFTIIPGYRFELAPINRQNILENIHAHSALFFLNTLFVLLAALFFTRIALEMRENIKRGKNAPDGETRPNNTETIPVILAITAAMFIGYAVVFALRSVIRRHTGYYLIGLHHFYPLALFATIGLYCIFILAEKKCVKNKDAFYGLTAGLLVLFSLLNAAKALQINIQFKSRTALQRLYIERFQAFIDRHKKEKDFSYQVDWRQVDDYVEERVGPPGKEELIKGNLSDLFFKKYVNSESPKYILLYFKESGIVSFADHKSAQEYLTARQKREKLPVEKFFP